MLFKVIIGLMVAESRSGCLKREKLGLREAKFFVQDHTAKLGVGGTRNPIPSLDPSSSVTQVHAFRGGI